VPIFNLSFIAFSDISPTPSTTETVGETGTFTISATAQPVTIRVDDDDLNFDDGFIDPNPTGTTSTANNNQLLVDPVTVNGTTFPVGSQVELEFAASTATQTFFYFRINGVNVGLTGADLPAPNQVITTTSNADGQSIAYDLIICFAAGTLIDTPAGPRSVETLMPGDLVHVMDGPARPLRWIGQRHLSEDDLRVRPHLRPIRIAEGALDNDRALMVSPQHRMLLSSWRAELMFGEREVLAPAISLVNDQTIRQVEPEGGVTYVHILFDKHEIVFAEGAPSESFYPGQNALTAIERDMQREIFEIFPELEHSPQVFGKPVRRVLRSFEGRALLE
jgi:hypothetical protein